MGTSNLIPGQLHCLAKVNADSSSPAFISARNVGSLTRSGAGVYTMVPDQPIDATEAALLATVNEANGIAVAIHTSDVLFTVNILSITTASPAVTAAADLDFSFAAFRTSY